MHISSILTSDNVVVNLEASSKEEALDALIAKVIKSPKVLDKERVREAVLEREQAGTTGVGDGIAIPHAKTDCVTDVVASFAVTKSPINFQSMDDQPVRLVFLLVGMESRVGTYLKLLSRIRKIMGSASFRKKLLQAENTSEIIEAFAKEEERYFEMAHH